jgi:hypothetical protein
VSSNIAKIQSGNVPLILESGGHENCCGQAFHLAGAQARSTSATARANFFPPPLQPHTRLFVTFAPEVVNQIRVRAGLKPGCQLVNPREDWQQVRFLVRRPRGVHRAFQIHKRLQYFLFDFAHQEETLDVR